MDLQGLGNISPSDFGKVEHNLDAISHEQNETTNETTNEETKLSSFDFGVLFRELNQGTDISELR